MPKRLRALWADDLQLQADVRVLDVGFGPPPAILFAEQGAPIGAVDGIDAAR
jgi:hypothetical protein